MYDFVTYEELYNYLGLENTPPICIDSREISPGDIFVAIKGKFFNGNSFVDSALQKGAKYVFVDDTSVLPHKYNLSQKISDKAITDRLIAQDTEKNEKIPSGTSTFLEEVIIIENKYIIVDNTIYALQQLAKIHRNHFSGLVIAITGSCGKTTTKELLNFILSSKFKVHASPGNYNSHIGLPISLLKMPMDTDIAIFEIGARNIGDIDLLCDIARPNMGLITNIKNVHLQGLKDITGVYKAKVELFDFLLKTKGDIFLNIDEELLLQYFKKHSRSHKNQFHFYGHTPKNDSILVTNEELSGCLEKSIIEDDLSSNSKYFLYPGIDRSSTLMLKKHVNNNSPYLHYSYNSLEKNSTSCFSLLCVDKTLATKPSMDVSNNTTIIATNILGDFNIYNVTAALKIALYLKIKPQIAHKAISNFKNPINRLELVNTKSNSILLDAYNSNLDSVFGSIDTLNKFINHKKVLILGDINDLGDLSDDIHITIYKETIKLVSDNNLNYHLILLCGLNFYKACNNDKNTILGSVHNNNILSFENKIQLEQFLKKKKNKIIDKTILIKASRTLQLETLIKFL